MRYSDENSSLPSNTLVSHKPSHQSQQQRLEQPLDPSPEQSKQASRRLSLDSLPAFNFRRSSGSSFSSMESSASEKSANEHPVQYPHRQSDSHLQSGVSESPVPRDERPSMSVRQMAERFARPSTSLGKRMQPETTPRRVSEVRQVPPPQSIDAAFSSVHLHGLPEPSSISHFSGLRSASIAVPNASSVSPISHSVGVQTPWIVRVLAEEREHIATSPIRLLPRRN